ncbi:MAG: decaprenyl-phosphate phosphoribosyltransferase [Actinomycetota bacterium]
MRPKQWVKNLLVVAAPLAAGRLTEPDVAVATAVAVVSFSMASSAVYLANDTADVEADRLHPTKRHRPIAAGHLSPRHAVLVAAVLAAGSVALAATASVALVVLMLGYLALQVAYVLSLKHQAVLDIAVVASGFLLRGVAGGLASDIRISEWFLLVAGFGSLFIVAGKRYSELRTLGGDGGTRRSLVRYTESYLRFIWGVATAITIMGYSLWAFNEPRTGDVPWQALSIVPFVLALMRYAVDIDAGRAGEPEDIVWHDRVLQLLGLVWLALVGIGVSVA